MRFLLSAIVLMVLCVIPPLFADRIEFADGRTLDNCFARDEGNRYLVWENMDAVGGSATVYPRSAVRSLKVERDDAWDEHPALPDLSVTFIEMNPKCPGLHGVVHYDHFGRPRPAGASIFHDVGEEAYVDPQQVVRDVQFQYEPGQEITLTAHVKNLGFVAAEPFDYTWLVDDVEINRGSSASSLAEMEEETFELKWAWQDGFHHVTFRIETEQTEIATINNEATDPLWGWGFAFIAHPERVRLWHQNRTAYGTFSFEDFYRWHVDIMNQLFEASIYPSAPNGIQARVRLDRIVYTEDVEAAAGSDVQKDGLRYDQGRWIWIDDDDRKGEWQAPTKEWRNQTEWSLPHELGHQLGLTDLYQLDYAGHEDHTMSDTGEPVTHFMNHPTTMMHWHGPHLWSEVDAGYLNMTWDKPRGHYGDYHFAIPKYNFLRFMDVNGRGVANAQVEIFQRGAMVDTEGSPASANGPTVYPVVEDGNFGHPVSAQPVVTGKTNSDGIFLLPNREVAEVRTLNGYHRAPNPFGNVNVVGQRGLMLVRITKEERPCHFWLEIADFNVAWFRGHKDRFTMLLKTPYGSVDSPLPPGNVTATSMESDRALVQWEAPAAKHEQHYLEKVTGYRVYRRVGNDGLNDRPWFPVATLPADARETQIDLDRLPQDIYWFSKVNRFAVSTIGELGIESELVETLLR